MPVRSLGAHPRELANRLLQSAYKIAGSELEADLEGAQLEGANVEEDVATGSFNGIFRDGCLNRWWFSSVSEAGDVIQAWLEECNQERPHGALEGQTPAECLAQYESDQAPAKAA